jgi:hypothetical protein
MNVINNVLIPDLKLLRASQERLIKFEDFISKRKKSIADKLSFIDKLATESEEILTRSAQWWAKKGKTVITSDNEGNRVEVTNPFYKTKLSDVYEANVDWLIEMLNENIRSIYNKLINQIVDESKRIDEMRGELHNFTQTILIPKHSGKPSDGVTTYPTFKEPLKTTAKEVLDKVTDIKTPITVGGHNIDVWSKWLKSEISHLEKRIEEVVDESPVSYIKVEETPVQSGRILHGERKELEQVTSAPLLSEVHTVTTRRQRLIACPQELMASVQPQRHSDGTMVTYNDGHSNECVRYDFREYNELAEIRDEQKSIIDPKFFDFGGTMSWYSGADHTRYEYKVKFKHVLRHGAFTKHQEETDRKEHESLNIFDRWLGERTHKAS